jgi:Protein of unknown function (DUF2510)
MYVRHVPDDRDTGVAMRVTRAFPASVKLAGGVAVAAMLAAVGLTPPASAAAHPQAAHQAAHAKAATASPRSVTQYDNELAGVSADSATDAWAVGGDQGPYITLHWNGTSWTKIRPTRPSPNSELFAVSAISPSDAWAVGNVVGSQPNSGSAWILRWNGTTWVRVTSPMPHGADDVLLAGVTAVSASDVWAVGSSSNSKGDFAPVALHWNGTSWSIVPTPQLNLGLLNAVTAVSASDAWAVGTYGANPEQVLMLHWNGTSWTKVAAPPLGTSIADLDGVSADSASDVWAAGWYKDPEKNLVLHWNGTSWTSVTVPTPGGYISELNGVTALSPDNVWAVGGWLTKSGQSSPGETLHWNGHTWANVATPDPAVASDLYAVSAVSANDVFAAGGTYTTQGGSVASTLLLRWNGAKWVRT